VSVELSGNGSRVAIRVRDQGAGIPTAEQSTIFDQFVRGSAAKSMNIKGTGVGLSMVRHIVRAHGGEITIEVNRVAVARSLCTFPPNPSMSPELPRELPAMTRILVIEDEPGIVLALEDDLKREGYEFETVGDGDVASRRAREERYDLILLDVMLPRKDGFEVCREVRRAGIRTPIILLTARHRRPKKVLGLELGADDYVTKPYSPRELRARIKAALRRSAATRLRSIGSGTSKWTSLGTRCDGQEASLR
jgi:CheY-like chemotaxis protein